MTEQQELPTFIKIKNIFPKIPVVFRLIILEKKSEDIFLLPLKVT